MTRRRPNGPRGDEGFTLVEVIVALALLTVTATAALYFFVGGTRAVSHQQQSQNAVVVANEAMERAYSIGAKRTGDVSGLLVGRHQDDVEAAWSSVATAGLEGYAATYPAWDPAAEGVGAGDDPSDNDAVPLKKVSELNNLEYEALTLIGPCYRSKVAADAACGKVSSATAPDSAPSGFSELMRVMVRVTWQSQSCPENGCSYQVSSLIDPNSDLTWNNTTKPIAVDDDAGVEVGKTKVINVLDNDIIGVVVNNPVQLVGTPTAGTATVQSDGTILYAAPPNASGIKTFTYKLKDQSGRESNLGTVRVRVTPTTVDDSASTIKNQPITFDVTANDAGTPGSVAIVTPPVAGRGTATASGRSITYSPGDYTGTATVTYRFTDADGLVSERLGTFTITVSAFTPPKSQDLVVKVPATRSGGTTFPIDLVGLTGNAPGYVVEVLSAKVDQGQLLVNTKPFNQQSNTRGTSLGYAQQGNVLGVWTFTYRVWTPDQSVFSETKTVTMVIMPAPVNDAYSFKWGSKNNPMKVGENDAPMNFGGTSQFTPQFTGLPNNCGSLAWSDARNGILQYNAPNRPNNGNNVSPRTCTFTYSIQGTGSYTNLVSDAATVTIQVTD
jgi:prepilin-type N-terminal cleavage/methylation domain-containing protein